MSEIRAIPWASLKKDLERRIMQEVMNLETCRSLEDMNRAQGALGALRKLLNLPGTLAVLTEEEEQ